MFEVSNVVNERPIGVRNNEIEDGGYLCPNNLILGRASVRVPSGPFDENSSVRKRCRFIQKLVNGFWKIWIRDYFPSLYVRQKWHIQKRQVKVGDIVLIKDTNAVRGNWQLGQIDKLHYGNDNVCRKVGIRYKIPVNKRCNIISRAVQNIGILLPVEENVTNNITY